MTSGKFRYDISVEVSFTEEEIALLSNTARSHYDMTGREAGYAAGEAGYRFNGFIAQLKLFPNLPAVWNSRQLNLCMKIIEMVVLKDRLEAEALCSRLYQTFDRIQQEHARLTEVI